MRFAADTSSSNARSWSNLQSICGGSADPDLAVGNEFIRRKRQVSRRRSATDAPGGIVLRTVARTEEPPIVALMRQRYAAEVRADADQPQPLIVALLHAFFVGLRIGQTCNIHIARLVDLLLGTMFDEDRLATPEHLD